MKSYSEFMVEANTSRKVLRGIGKGLRILGKTKTIQDLKKNTLGRIGNFAAMTGLGMAGVAAAQHLIKENTK